ncbi:hypothetical protein C8Q75DRAFT_731786 [Abortiporus biennis]|nr:hypothetical protein C8Q75DRAFT_731786 [Abortiporus biennis]
MFRLPSHIESFIPPPRAQLPQSRPWRGKLIWHTHNATPIPVPPVEIFCTAAETEGDNQVELWPPQFYVNVLTHRALLPEVHAYLRRGNHPPMCMFMPDRITDQDTNRSNLANFEQLSRILMENQFVSLVQFNGQQALESAVMILFPTATSRALLVGAIFLRDNFPDFLVGIVQGLPPRPPNIRISRQIPYNPLGAGNSPYDPAPPNISSSSRHVSG